MIFNHKRRFIHLIPFCLSTIWYELQARDWPITNQPVEATIWQVGSGEGIKKVLAEISLGKEVTVSWKNGIQVCQSFRKVHRVANNKHSWDQDPSCSVCTALTPRCLAVSGDPLCLLGVRPERQAHLHPAGRHAGEAAQTQPQAVSPRTLLEVCRVGIQRRRRDVKRQKDTFCVSVYFLALCGTVVCRQSSPGVAFFSFQNKIHGLIIVCYIKKK